MLTTNRCLHSLRLERSGRRVTRAKPGLPCPVKYFARLPLPDGRVDLGTVPSGYSSPGFAISQIIRVHSEEVRCKNNKPHLSLSAAMVFSNSSRAAGPRTLLRTVHGLLRTRRLTLHASPGLLRAPHFCALVLRPSPRVQPVSPGPVCGLLHARFPAFRAAHGGLRAQHFELAPRTPARSVSGLLRLPRLSAPRSFADCSAPSLLALSPLADCSAPGS
jgi:hypothetical protein